jgi:hypothetical protein
LRFLVADSLQQRAGDICEPVHKRPSARATSRRSIAIDPELSRFNAAKTVCDIQSQNPRPKADAYGADRHRCVCVNSFVIRLKLSNWLPIRGPSSVFYSQWW